MTSLILPLLYQILALVAMAAGLQTGTDRLFDSHLDLVRGKRVAVLAHNASRVRDGTHLVDLLFERSDLELKLIFAPEHGFRGAVDAPVPDSKDEATGLPVVSLYGPRKAPEPQHLQNIDVLVIDLQDVGMRFYTYATTMALTMQACRQAGKKVVVLDRPNPINGELVEGPLTAPEFTGKFISYYPIPLRHGMTMGELARLFNSAFEIGADLDVVPMSGWKPSENWSETGLTWQAPSPALERSEQAVLYSLFGVLEALNFAVGRGATNEQAFRVFGAPWIAKEKARELVAALQGLKLPGLVFSYAAWRPDRREFSGKLCRGFRVRISDQPKASRLGQQATLGVLALLQKHLGPTLKLDGLDAYFGATWVREGLRSGVAADKLLRRARAEARLFQSTREAALLYARSSRPSE